VFIFVLVHFRSLSQHLRGYISHADFIVGCVAWLTDFSILKAFSGVPEGVSIFVQKEDFLRPDCVQTHNWKRQLRALYDSVPPLRFCRYDLGPFMKGLSYCGDVGFRRKTQRQP